MNAEAVSKVLRALDSYHWEVQPNATATWGAASCPLAPFTHGGSGRDMNPSLMVSISPGRSHAKCLSCDFSGGVKSLVETVHRHGGLALPQLEQLMPFITAEEQRAYTVVQRDYTPQLPAFLENGLRRTHPYWQQRGLDRATVDAWGLGYSDDVERVLVPFWDTDGTLLGIIGRDVSGSSSMKYRVYPDGFPRSQYLFGEHLLSGAEQAVLVVEGYLDAPTAWQYLPAEIGVVALGTALPSVAQLRRVAGLAPEIILGLDNPEQDVTGARAFTKAYNYLLGRRDISVLDYGEYKDANDAGPELARIVAERRRGLILEPLLAQLRGLSQVLGQA